MQKTIETEFRALGTQIFVQLVIDDGQERTAQKDLAKLKKIYFKKQKIFNRFDKNSELSLLNNNLKKYHRASSDLIAIAKKSLHYNETTNGLFDPRILENLEINGYIQNFSDINFKKIPFPPLPKTITAKLENDLKIKGSKIFFGRKMDFNGIAKGYITDLAAKFLKQQGWKNFLVDSGGDMRIAGLNNEHKKWRIALENYPESNLMLNLTNEAIATSGISRKQWKVGKKGFHHLVNPFLPNKYSFELRSVTVIEDTAKKADILAKTLFLMGKREGVAYSNLNDIASIFLDKSNKAWLSNKIKNYLV